MSFANLIDGQGKSTEPLRNRWQLQGQAQRELGHSLDLQPSEITTRSLRPEDLGLSPSNDGEFTFSLSSGDNEVINSSGFDRRFIVISGVRFGQANTPVSVQVKIKKGGSDVRFWNLQGAILNADSALYFEDPILIRQRESLVVTVSANGVNTAEKLIFLGSVIEKAGRVTAKDDVDPSINPPITTAQLDQLGKPKFEMSASALDDTIKID